MLLLCYALGTTLKYFIHYLLPTDLNRDVRKVTFLLKNLEKDELEELFLELGLLNTTVQNKKSASTQVYAKDLIRSWILGKDDVLKSEEYRGGATWENLKKALVKLNHSGIAEQIPSRYEH